MDKEDVGNMLTTIEDIYERRGVTQDEKDMIWQTIATFCQYQLEARRGLFYDAVRHLLKPEVSAR